MPSFDLESLAILIGLIEAQDWIKLEEVILSKPETFKVISKMISHCEEFNGSTLLHACVRYDPPARLLYKMIRLYPQALKAEDSFGRTVLHVAAGSGASPSVIKVLAKCYPQACNIQDRDGSTPLLLACDSTCTLFEDDEYIPRGPPNLETIHALLICSPGAATLEDEGEFNAIFYALSSNASMEVISLLQRTAQKVLISNKFTIK